MTYVVSLRCTNKDIIYFIWVDSVLTLETGKVRTHSVWMPITTNIHCVYVGSLNRYIEGPELVFPADTACGNSTGKWMLLILKLLQERFCLYYLPKILFWTIFFLLCISTRCQQSVWGRMRCNSWKKEQSL